MYCTKCGVELGEHDRFCSDCGAANGVGEAPAAAQRRPELALDVANKKIAGVCAGFARYLEVDTILVRIVWLSLALATGVGFIAYLIAWILMPKDRPAAREQSSVLAHQNG